MTPLPIAALIYDPETDPAPALVEVVRALRTRGVTLAGAIQHATESCAMELEFLSSDRRMSIAQNMGSGAGSCRLDARALAEAASVIRQAIDSAPSLAIFNKFGTQEAEGKGLHDEITAAVTAGVPVLIPVGERFLPQWSAFTGGEFAALPCTAHAALSWWDAISEDGPSHHVP
jgi:hypothetical protein